jgi:hypothetical protein
MNLSGNIAIRSTPVVAPLLTARVWHAGDIFQFFITKLAVSISLGIKDLSRQCINGKARNVG